MIEIEEGDTDTAPYGLGTYGSRSTPVAGAAAARVGRKIRAKAQKIAAYLLEVAEDDLEWDIDRFQVKGLPGKRQDDEGNRLGRVSQACPKGMEPGLEAVDYYDPPNMTYPFGAYICVDRHRHGDRRGQGPALLRARRLRHADQPDDHRGPGARRPDRGVRRSRWARRSPTTTIGNIQGATFMDYFLPTAVETPVWETDFTVTPSPHHPIGAKGVGESPNVGGVSAFSNAVDRRLRPPRRRPHADAAHRGQDLAQVPGIRPHRRADRGGMRLQAAGGAPARRKGEEAMAGSALIVGVGDGISASFARLLAKDGIKVGLAARRPEKLEALRAEIGGVAFGCDVTEAGEVERLFAEADEKLGALDVVHYNPSYRAAGPLGRPRSRGGPEDADGRRLRRLPGGPGGGAAHAAAGAAAPSCSRARRRASRATPGSAPFAMGKFALRGLAQSLARELAPKNIHVAHFVIDGGVRSASRPEPAERPDSLLDPDAIAQSYLAVLRQPRSAWSWEVELRPWVETF